jgi:hypothetical protein
MDFMNATKHALSVGTPKPAASSSARSPKKAAWPAQFRDPVDAAFAGMPQPSPSKQEESANGNLHFFD